MSSSFRRGFACVLLVCSVWVGACSSSLPDRPSTPESGTRERNDAVVAALRAGEWDRVEQMLTDTMRSAVTRDELAEAWKTVTRPLGEYATTIETRRYPRQTREREVTYLQFEKGVLELRVKWTPDGRIDGMQVARGEASLRALLVARRTLRGELDTVYARFSPKLQAALPRERFGTIIDQVRGEVGDDVTLGESELSSGQLETVNLQAEGKAGAFLLRVSFAPGSDRIEGIYITHDTALSQPNANLPPYADADSFSEREVQIGPEGRSLPGTLSLPKSVRPVAAIVLVHGSGPNDRDETTLANKPFRDLAAGLATREIAVLRYEKRSFGANRRSLRDPATITLDEDTVDDAVHAAQLLLGTQGVDENRVFVLGHSQGGMAAPLILEREPRLRGAVIMAGPARPLEDMIMSQLRHLASLQPSAASDAQLSRLQQQVARVKAGNLGEAQPQELPLGIPPSFWSSLAGYSAPDRALALHKPLLVLQGERDYQVTSEDFAIWRDKLAGRPWASLRSFPGLNHLFQVGQGPSTPLEYARAGYMDERVIAAIAEWVLSLPDAPDQDFDAR